MADFAQTDIDRLQAKRVLIIVGAAHKHFLEDIFVERGMKIVPSSSLFE